MEHTEKPLPATAHPDYVWVVESTAYGWYGILGVYGSAETAFAYWPGEWRFDTTYGEWLTGEANAADESGGLRLYREPFHR